jgi:hypothetical protein
MTHTLKTKLVRVYETDGPIHGAMGQILTDRQFFLKNGIWLQVHQFESIQLAAIWDLPKPGEFVKRGNPNAGVGAS